MFDSCSIVVQRLSNILARLNVKKRLKEILNSLPQQPPRSRLEAYSDLIEAMRARNWTYRGIARVLTEKCGIRVSASNLHHFVKHHLTTNVVAEEKCSAMESFRNGASSQTRPGPATSISKHIDSLDHHLQEPKREEDVFEFDPAVPLRLPSQKNNV